MQLTVTGDTHGQQVPPGEATAALAQRLAVMDLRGRRGAAHLACRVVAQYFGAHRGPPAVGAGALHGHPTLVGASCQPRATEAP